MGITGSIVNPEILSMSDSHPTHGVDVASIVLVDCGVGVVGALDKLIDYHTEALSGLVAFKRARLIAADGIDVSPHTRGVIDYIDQLDWQASQEADDRAREIAENLA